MVHRLLWFYFLFSLATLTAGTLPLEFEATLKGFRADGTKGWAFTQTTKARKDSLVERYDPTKPEFVRWTLVEKNGKAPTEKEAREYQEKHTRRSGEETAPDVTKQLDLSTAEQVSEDAERAVYRFHLKSGGKDDTTAQYMTSLFTFHKASGTIERVELGNTEPFSPMMAVKIQEARTVITYTLPTADRPTLLDQITVRIRGRAMLVRSLDEDMTVSYSDYHYAGKKPTAALAPTPKPAEPATAR